MISPQQVGSASAKAKSSVSAVGRLAGAVSLGGAMALASVSVPVAAQTACDWVSYPDFCIPPYPPDLECWQIGAGWFTVNAPDPHSLDGDFDGIGCEG
jgi:micrococcal nuclease